ncbi:hypothetical protein [Paenibacillus apiarius]|uniref:Uncharacterized protein n=1 Tax=Paenibacillus apiarius TaxID=46240 RepID=A0ABT4DQS2_9BACL|nr:hypothetical protein [Paenibacillus apiarius]MCY9513332.1 hypothetical protein [Paenibacillus apiarius]MCY9519696.1 hypothetical protein [Paenibacillus apiarius]MCY9553248.1 hypothetical protein [Paenibacillus apiarius]MCY9557098.1 hypothetical protein [Paenibacillus apiarius]MCY9682161.1 hypothetical protein [Paenibacillus apiarius]
MNAYEKVFNGFAAILSPEELGREARIFYVHQIRTILGWTDMTDSEQIKEIRTLDSAFHVIIGG